MVRPMGQTLKYDVSLLERLYDSIGGESQGLKRTMLNVNVFLSAHRAPRLTVILL